MEIFGRYTIDAIIARGSQLGSPRTVSLIRRAIKNGSLPINKTLVVTEGDRLDTIAGVVYGDARLWWVLAAASNIGWCPQVPPGTVVNVVNLSKVESLVT